MPKLQHLLAALLACSSLPVLAEPTDVEAVTSGGDKVMLHPNGRWDYVDSQKARTAGEVARQFPENQACPPGAQGGYFGVGRCIMPGDKDYNRRSMSGK